MYDIFCNFSGPSIDVEIGGLFVMTFIFIASRLVRLYTRMYNVQINTFCPYTFLTGVIAISKIMIVYFMFFFLHLKLMPVTCSLLPLGSWHFEHICRTWNETNFVHVNFSIEAIVVLFSLAEYNILLLQEVEHWISLQFSFYEDFVFISKIP